MHLARQLGRLMYLSIRGSRIDGALGCLHGKHQAQGAVAQMDRMGRSSSTYDALLAVLSARPSHIGWGNHVPACQGWSERCGASSPEKRTSDLNGREEITWRLSS